MGLRTATLLLLLTALGACGPDMADVGDLGMASIGSGGIEGDASSGEAAGDDSPGEAGPNVGDPDDGWETIDVWSQKNLDIVLVVDASRSMAEEQANLANNAAAFIAVLEREDVKANYRLAIVSTDMGNPWCSTPSKDATPVTSSCWERLDDFVYAPGTFNEIDVRESACRSLCNEPEIVITPTVTDEDSVPRPRPWLESLEGATNFGSSSSLDVARCAIPQGIGGCNFPQPLAALERALERMRDPADPTYGFLRDDAVLAVVFITAAEDCSYAQSHTTALWSATGTHRFWEDSEAAQPTQAVCWNAGARCVGGPGTYDVCLSESYDEEGIPGATATDAVLTPVDQAIAALQAVEDEKKNLHPNREVLVAVITGVPTNYPQADVVYQDASVAADQLQWGIGFGCQSVSGNAIPPVRLRAFAEHFRVDDEHEVLYSICADNYSAVFGPAADAIAEQIRPACYSRCVADLDSAPGLQFSCEVEEVAPGSASVPVPPCLVTGVNNVDWDFASPSNNICYLALTDHTRPGGTGIDDEAQECVDENLNMQFVVNRRQGFPGALGTVVRARCEPDASGSACVF